jgi:hypothetical protein
VRGGGKGWSRSGLRAPGAHGASMGGFRRKRGWSEVWFPRWPRRRWRGARRRGGGPSSGLTAAARRGEAVGVVEYDGGGAEVRARRRQELTGEEGHVGEVALVEVRPRGVASER